MEDDCCLPPPPPKEGDCGYEEYVRRRATEELIYHEEQAKKWAEWDQVSLKFKTMKRGFTAEVKAEEPMVDPLQVLLASVPAPLGSTTVTKEEDLLLSVGDVTTTEIVVRLPPKETEHLW